MSIGPAIAWQVAMIAQHGLPQGTKVDVARVLSECPSVREAGSTSSRQRPINRWWAAPRLFEIAVTGNTEKGRACLGAYKVLRANARSIASRSAKIDRNPAAGLAGPLSVVSDSASGRRRRPAEIAEIALIGKGVEKSASDGDPRLLAQIAQIAEMSRPSDSIACRPAGGTSKSASETGITVRIRSGVHPLVRQ